MENNNKNQQNQEKGKDFKTVQNSNSYKVTYETEKKGKSKVSFGRNFLLPFVSGVLGCTVVIGACFGIPSIRNKLLDTSSNTSNSSNLSSQGYVSQTSLSNYSDTSIYAANKKDSNKETTNQKIKEVYKEFFVKIIPICIATIVFCFAGWDPISSFGMIMFWGIVLIAIYNYIITSTLVKIQDNNRI